MEVVVKRASPAVLLFVAAALGCHDTGPCGLRRCDIREPDCQRRTAEAAACLRQVEPIPIAMTVVDRDAYIQSEVSAPVDPEQKEQWTRTNVGLGLLGLGDPQVGYADAVAANSGWVAAFYSGKDKMITILSRKDFHFDSAFAVTLLVHESVHALQDQAGRLSGSIDPADDSLDRGLAAVAMIEGEADLMQDLAALELFERDESQVPWARVFAKSLARADQYAAIDPLPIERSYQHFAYAFGSAYLHGARASGGATAIDGIWTAPPVSTRQVMAGFGAPEPNAGPWLENLGADSEPALPDALARVAGDRLGAFALGVFLANLRPAPGLSTLYSSPVRAAAAAELRGDHISIFYDPTADRTVTAWRLRFSRAETAAQLAELIRHGPDRETPLWQVEARDRDLIVLASNVSQRDGYLGTQVSWRAPPAPPPPPQPPEPADQPIRCAGSQRRLLRP
jgi:hypothetical protein